MDNHKISGNIKDFKEAMIQAVLRMNQKYGDNSVILRRDRILSKKKEYITEINELYKEELSKINKYKLKTK